MNQQKKNYSRTQLENAYERGGRTIGGGARILGCDWKTFRKYWEQLQHQESLEPTYVEDEEETTELADEFTDEKVRNIVEDYRAQKMSNRETFKSVIHEIVDKIDLTEREIETKQRKLEQMKNYLKNMEL